MVKKKTEQKSKMKEGGKGRRGKGEKIKNFVLILIIPLIVFIFDRVLRNLKVEQCINSNFLEACFIHTVNKGIAFGIQFNFVFLLILNFLILLICLFFVLKTDYKGFLFLFTGGLSNFADRILFGYVRDYFYLKIFGFSFSYFNLADLLNIIGLILIITKAKRNLILK